MKRRWQRERDREIIRKSERNNRRVRNWYNCHRLEHFPWVFIDHLIHFMKENYNNNSKDINDQLCFSTWYDTFAYDWRWQIAFISAIPPRHKLSNLVICVYAIRRKQMWFLQYIQRWWRVFATFSGVYIQLKIFDRLVPECDSTRTKTITTTNTIEMPAPQRDKNNSPILKIKCINLEHLHTRKHTNHGSSHLIFFFMNDEIISLCLINLLFVSQLSSCALCSCMSHEKHNVHNFEYVWMKFRGIIISIWMQHSVYTSYTQTPPVHKDDEWIRDTRAYLPTHNTGDRP